jgi:threonine synthase
VSAWHLECSACDHVGGGRAVASVCPRCGQPLLVRYDSPWPPRDRISARWDIWRYRAVLPIDDDETPVSLGEGVTPLLETPALARAIGVSRLWIKDEGRNPTASFKARGMSAAVTRAKALGVPGLVVPTAGNAGAALAAYGAAASLLVRVFAPANTPAPILATIRALGAELELVDGHIGDAGKRSRAFAEAEGWFDVSTLREPYRIEGKKTMGLELAEQLGWELPDVIFYPTGGGTGLIGMWKAFAELEAIGFIGSKRPRMVAVQADGCAPMVRAYEAGAETATRWENAHTIASGIRVPQAVGDFLILRAVRESGGFAIAVSDEAITDAVTSVAQNDGLLLCPEGGATMAAYQQALADGRVRKDEQIVLFNCATGLKYPMPPVHASLDRNKPIDFSKLR